MWARLPAGSAHRLPRKRGRRLCAAARGPKRLIMVEGAGHSRVLWRAGGAVYEAVRALTARGVEGGAPQSYC